MSEAVLSLARRLLHDQGGEKAALHHLERSLTDHAIAADANIWAAIGYLRKALGDAAGAERAYTHAASLKRAALQAASPVSWAGDATQKPALSPSPPPPATLPVVQPVAPRADRRAMTRLHTLRARTADLLHMRDASRKRAENRRSRREGRFDALFSRSRMLSRQTANLLDAVSRTRGVEQMRAHDVMSKGYDDDDDDDDSSSSSASTVASHTDSESLDSAVREASSEDESGDSRRLPTEYEDEFSDRVVYGSDGFYDGVYDEVESDDVADCSDAHCAIAQAEQQIDDFDAQVVRGAGHQPPSMEWANRWHINVLSASEHSLDFESASELESESLCGADSELYCGVLCDGGCPYVQFVEPSFEESSDEESEEDMSYLCEGLNNLDMIVWHAANLSSEDEHADGETSAIAMSDTLSQFMAEDEWSVAEEGEDHMWLDEWDKSGRGVEDIERIAPAQDWKGGKVVCVICTEEIHGKDSEQQSAGPSKLVRTLPCSKAALDEASRGKDGVVAGHTFHAECIDKWLQKNHTCPTCRSHIGV